MAELICHTKCMLWTISWSPFGDPSFEVPHATTAPGLDTRYIITGSLIS